MNKTKIISETTEKAVRKHAGVNPSLSYTTRGNTFLNKILENPEAISLQASGIDYFWDNQATRLPDDNQEFIGAFNLFDYMGFSIPKDKLNSKESIYKDVESRLFDDLKETAGAKCLASSTTPYILCFSTSLVDKELSCRFCNKSNDFAITLLLDFDKLIYDDSINKIRKRGETSDKNDEILNAKEIYKEMMQIYYIDKPEFCQNSNTRCCHTRAMTELQSINSINARQRKDDYNIDACFYVKRSNFACEKEIRYIFRTNEHCGFALTDDKKLKFVSLNDKNQKTNTQPLLIQFKIEILKGLVFGPCVSKEEAEDYAAKVIKKCPSCKDIQFLLHDGTTIETTISESGTK